MTTQNKVSDALVQRLRAARVAKHGKGPLKLPSVPCLYEEAADRIEELEAAAIFTRDVIVHRPSGSSWYAEALKQLVAVVPDESGEL